MENVYRKEEKLYIKEVENGLILPRIMCNSGPSWGLGGVCDQKNQFVEESFYDGGWAQHGGIYSVENEFYDAREVLYIGLYVKHWGHFLIDCISKMWPLVHEDYQKMCIAYLGEEKIQGNYLEFLVLMGIQENQLIQVNNPTRFAKVYVPQASFRPCIWYTREYEQMLDTIVDNALNNFNNDDFKDIERVYFGRRQFEKALSSEFGEKYFEDTFIRNGYLSIAPESLSLREQIYIWNKSKEIVCINGSIPLNVMFCRNKDLKLTVFNKMSLYHKNPYILLYMRKIEAIFVDIYKEPLKGYPKSLGEGPYLLKATDDFKRYCREKNIVIPYSEMKLQLYSIVQEGRYYLCILGLKRRCRLLLSKVIARILKR